MANFIIRSERSANAVFPSTIFTDVIPLANAVFRNRSSTAVVEAAKP
jgi:hypothetical protein